MMRIEYGEGVTGHGFDLIRLVTPPLNEREERWIEEVLRCRLLPGGKLVNDY
jgi:hypothetical protein